MLIVYFKNQITGFREQGGSLQVINGKICQKHKLSITRLEAQNEKNIMKVLYFLQLQKSGLKAGVEVARLIRSS